jgi:Fic family protein
MELFLKKSHFMLPTDIPISADELRLIASIDEFKGSWRLLEGMYPEHLRSLRRVATIESVGSSTRIEGAKLTDAEVEALLGRVGTESFASRDEQEVAGYARVMELVFAAHAEMRVSENLLFQLHRDLLSYSTKDERHRGSYKTLPNNVSAFDADGREIGVIFATAIPFDTPRRMDELLAWNERSEQLLHPLVRIGLFIVEFLAIHPFQDGNGRLSRVLTTLLMLQAGYTHVPYSSLESIIEHNKEGYYLALRRTQTTMGTDHADWAPWLLYFLNVLSKQARHLEKKLTGPLSVGTLRSGLSPMAGKILIALQLAGSITVTQAAKTAGINRNTAKNKLRELLQTGAAELRGKGRGAHYVPTG